MSKASRLRRAIIDDEATILMEAHNGLTARLVQEAGFRAIWGSGLCLSAALGVRDCNELSWTQVLDALEFMSDATEIPILLDGDTGYGNFNNVRRLVKKLEQRRIAGVCLEDKLFPKNNSFVGGEQQPLATLDEMCGKLRAAKDTQLDPDFVVVARTEAFIAGWGPNEALRRAVAYSESGADAILVHSKRGDGRDIMDFMALWQLDTPVVIVPTMYPSEPLSSFMAVGITNFIFANQTLRTTITAVRDNLATLRRTRDLMSIEREIAPVPEVFRLQDVGELMEAEARYLPRREDQRRAVILAAGPGGPGERGGGAPADTPEYLGRPVLSWHVDALEHQRITRIGVVRGSANPALEVSGLHVFDDEEHARTGELHALYQARDFLCGPTLVMPLGVIVDQHILRSVLEHEAEFTIVVDARVHERGRRGHPLVRTCGMHHPARGEQACELVELGVDASSASGAWFGLLSMSSRGTAKVREFLDQVAEDDPQALRRMGLSDLLGALRARGGSIHVLHVLGHWSDLDDPQERPAGEQHA